MNNFANLLTDLRAAIAVVAARDRGLSAFLGLVWVRVARMGARLERLIGLWRAGRLPEPRKSRAGAVRSAVRAKPVFPTSPAWLLAHVREAGAFGSQLEHLLSGEEAKAFLAAVPRAARILRPLCRMLGVGVVVRPTRRARPVWLVRVAVPLVEKAGLVLGPGGRLIYV